MEKIIDEKDEKDEKDENRYYIQNIIKIKIVIFQ